MQTWSECDDAGGISNSTGVSGTGVPPVIVRLVSMANRTMRMVTRSHSVNRYASLCVFVSLILSGCQSQQPTASAEAPIAADLIAAHNARLDKIDHLESSGQLDLTWSDDDGDHFEVVNIRLVIDRPQHTSLRIEKFGDWMWLGSDDAQYWFFDMRNEDDKILYLGRFDDMSVEREIPGLPHPLRLLDLAGLTPLPDDAVVVFDETLRRWAIEGAGRGGSIRIFFHPTWPWPERIESYGADGGLLFTSDLRRYDPLTLPDQPPGAFPYFPRQIEIAGADQEGSAKLTLDSPTGRVDASVLERAFDLELLQQRLRPHRVEELAEGEAISDEPRP